MHALATVHNMTNQQCHNTVCAPLTVVSVVNKIDGAECRVVRCVSKKRHHFCFCNNLVECQSISVIFLAQ